MFYMHSIVVMNVRLSIVELLMNERRLNGVDGNGYSIDFRTQVMLIMVLNCCNDYFLYCEISVVRESSDTALVPKLNSSLLTTGETILFQHARY